MAEKKPVYWLGEKVCDFCGIEEPQVLIDGRTKEGFWALMCEVCFKQQGVGLGTGRGQKYEAQEIFGTKTYIKTEG